MGECACKGERIPAFRSTPSTILVPRVHRASLIEEPQEEHLLQELKVVVLVIPPLRIDGATMMMMKVKIISGLLLLLRFSPFLEGNCTALLFGSNDFEIGLEVGGGLVGFFFESLS